MSKNVTIQGASYSDVPGILIPQTGGGTAYFADPSDVTATPADVLAGKAFLDSSGVLQNGTLQNAVTVTDTLDAAGGTVRTITGGVYGRYGTLNFTKIASLGTQTFYFGADTSYDTNKDKTSATSIKATANYGTFTATSIADYEYYILWTCKTDFVYTEGTTLVAAPVTEVNVHLQTILRRPTSVANFKDRSFANTSYINVTSMPLLYYYNTNGAEAITLATSYGVYCSVTAPTISSATAASPTITARCPAINIRCNASYFSTDMSAAVDQTKSKVTISCDVYRGEVGGPMRTMLEDAVNAAFA